MPGYVRLDQLVHSETYDRAKLIITSECGYLPVPQDEDEKIAQVQGGSVFFVAASSSKACCRLNPPGLEITILICPTHNDVILVTKRVSTYLDLSCLESTSAAFSGSRRRLDPHKLEHKLHPGFWRLFWPSPSPASGGREGSELSLDMLVLPSPYRLHIRDKNGRQAPISRAELSWNSPLTLVSEGDQVSVRAPPSMRHRSSEEYTLVCEKMIYEGNSVVFSALHTEHGLVAVKVLKVDGPSNDLPSVRQWVVEWLREVQITRKLIHPHIIRFVGADARTGAIFTKYHARKSLGHKSRLDKEDFFTGRYRDARRILCDMSSVLEYLGSQRVLHNDIKPANILYDSNCGCLLIDFGAVTELGTVTGYSMPQYICPEYIGGRERGLPSDMFALGVVMLFALRIVPLPEYAVTRFRPHVAARDAHSSDGQRARSWLRDIERIRTHQLLGTTPINSLVASMLDPDPGRRITARRLREESMRLT